jgi:pimeloyl-ACP methyl ester carboxylesterase
MSMTRALLWWIVFGLIGVNILWRISKLPRERRRRVAFRELSILLLVYCGTMAMLMFLERKLIFVPSTAAEYWHEPSGLKYEDIWLRVEAEEEQCQCHAWWCTKNGATDTLLYCHGNAGNLSGRAEVLKIWQSLDLNVLIFDYPGYGRSSGAPSEASCQAAAAAAYAWLTKDKRIPGQNIILFGKSLGGAMAVELAISRPSKALVLYSAFTSVPDLAQRSLPFFPSRYLVRTQFNNEAKLPRYHGPLFIGHGAEDSLIPVECADRLWAACDSKSKVLRKYQAEDHGAPPPQFYADVGEFLKELPPAAIPK